MDERQRGSLARPELAGRSRRQMLLLAVVLVALAAIAAVNVHPALSRAPGGDVTALTVVAEVLAFGGVALMLLAAVLALLLRSAISPEGVDLRTAATVESAGRLLRTTAVVLVVAGPLALALALLTTGSDWKAALVGLLSALAPYGLLLVVAVRVHQLGRTFARL